MIKIEYIFFIVAMGLHITTLTCFAQEMKPPLPKDAMTVFQYPEPVISKELKGNASLPSQAKLNFGLDLGNLVRRGNWNVQGQITSVAENKVSFKTSSGEKGNLVFRLPDRMILPLKSGMFFKLNRKIIGIDSSLGYSLVLESQTIKMVLSGRLHSHKPLRLDFTERFRLVQKGKGSILSDTKFEKIYKVPVSIEVGTRKIDLPLNENTNVELNGGVYNIHILQSTLTEPSKRYKGLEEGSGYYLEYVMVQDD
jgi:hypothetical protein